MRVFLFFVSTVWAALSGDLAYADDLAPRIKPPIVDAPKRVLLVGNSYLFYGDSVHNHVRRMVAAAGLHEISDLEFKSATISGAALRDHDIESYLEPERMRVDQPFEVVVLQGHSSAALSQQGRDRFRWAVEAYAGKITGTGGRTALYMTHAYVPPHKQYRDDMIRDIEAMYVEAGNAVGALVIPVGLAFEEAYRRNPAIKLHKDFDGSHPNLFGTYLAAATVFACLYNTSPVGNAYDYFGAVDRETVVFLQHVAWETVTAFYE